MSATGHHVLSLFVTMRAMLIRLELIDTRTAQGENAEANGFEVIADFVIRAFRVPSLSRRPKQLLIHHGMRVEQYIFLSSLHNLLFLGGHKWGRWRSGREVTAPLLVWLGRANV
ncbi:MAG TPA: hypothetical protein VF553_10940 [Pyrinomonadaceae bacterium]